jgi:hypothetical protein
MSAVGTDVRGRVRELILESLAAPYTSRSGTDGTETGNHYQSVALDGEATGGFRTNREAILDRVDFRGRTVLDLGANLGEMSRSARARGARLVQGLEYDPFFVEIAQLVTAYNGIARVSFRQADITDPANYGERYDVVLALSVFHYLREVLDPLAQATDVLILETHKLDGNLDATYLDPILQRFPFMEVLGETDFGWTDAGKARCVIAFAKTKAQLDDVLVPAGEWRRPAVPRSRPAERVRVKPRCFAPLDRFFATWDYEDADALLEAVGSVEVPSEALLTNRDLHEMAYHGWSYWFLFLQGWLDHRARGTLADDNPYLEYVARHFAPHGPDPVLAQAVADGDDDAAREVVRRRFDDLDRLAAQREEEGAVAAVDPIRVVVAPRTPRIGFGIETTQGRPLAAWRVDGWHRAFGARLFGLRRLDAHVEYEPPFVPTMKGQVDTLAIADARVRVSGWCVTPEPFDAVEIRVDGDRLGVAPIGERPDVAAAFPDLAHASRSGFELDAGWPGWWDRRPATFEIVALRDWLPIGRLRFDWAPGMLDGPFPPPEVAERADGHGHPQRLALRATTTARELVEAVGRYRAPATFASALHWDAGSALLARALAPLLPKAQIASAGGDAEAVAWAEQAGVPGTLAALPETPPTPFEEATFDLVLRDRPLAALSHDELHAWLGELRRIVRPGGYVSAVGGWSASARDAALDVVARSFDVVALRYLTGWAGGEIVVLRAP